MANEARGYVAMFANAVDVACIYCLYILTLIINGHRQYEFFKWQ